MLLDPAVKPRDDGDGSTTTAVGAGRRRWERDDGGGSRTTAMGARWRQRWKAREAGITWTDRLAQGGAN